MNKLYTNKITEDLVFQIRELGKQMNELSKCFREGIFSEEHSEFNKFSGNDWRRNVYGNGLVRLRQFTEQNFQFIETMGLIAVSRYIFELNVWLLLLDLNENYGLLYYHKLLNTQLRFYEDSVKHLSREVQLLRTFEGREKDEREKVLQDLVKTKDITPEKIRDLLKQPSVKIDNEANKKFAIYLDEAKINGYGFQAHLIEEQSIQKGKAAIAELENELKILDESLTKEQKEIFPKRWKWNDMAKKTGMIEEYEYIYSYTSKLLHATPASLTTNQKNLELKEVNIFLRYIHTKLLEIIELSKKQPEFLLNYPNQKSSSIN